MLRGCTCEEKFMMTERVFLCPLCGGADDETMRRVVTKDEDSFNSSFDARDWARAFVAYVTINPSIATDEGTMIGWFANALMRGFDEATARREAIEKQGDQNLAHAKSRVHAMIEAIVEDREYVADISDAAAMGLLLQVVERGNPQDESDCCPMPSSLTATISSHVGECGVARAMTLNGLAKEFLDRTGLSPNRAELIEHIHADGSVSYYFQERGKEHECGFYNGPAANYCAGCGCYIAGHKETCSAHPSARNQGPCDCGKTLKTLIIGETFGNFLHDICKDEAKRNVLSREAVELAQQYGIPPEMPSTANSVSCPMPSVSKDVYDSWGETAKENIQNQVDRVNLHLPMKSNVPSEGPITIGLTDGTGTGMQAPKPPIFWMCPSCAVIDEQPQAKFGGKEVQGVMRCLKCKVDMVRTDLREVGESSTVNVCSCKTFLGEADPDCPRHGGKA